MDEINVAPGKLLIKQGDSTGDAFLITAGRVEVFRAVDGVKSRLALLGAGEIAGEMGLIDSAPRSACIATVGPTRLVVISRDLFLRQLRASPPLVRFVLHSLIRTLRLISGISTMHGDPIFADDPIISERTHKILRRDTFAAGRTIFRQGDEAHCAYLIQSGTVEISREMPEGKTLVLGQAGAGTVFGEMALLRDAGRNATVIATDLTVCELIHRQRFEELLRAAPPLIRQLINTYVQRIERSS